MAEAMATRSRSLVPGNSDTMALYENIVKHLLSNRWSCTMGGPNPWLSCTTLCLNFASTSRHCSEAATRPIHTPRYRAVGTMLKRAALGADASTNLHSTKTSASVCCAQHGTILHLGAPSRSPVHSAVVSKHDVTACK